MTFFAVLLFFAAAYFVALALRDNYSTAQMHKLYGNAFGNHPSLFWMRFVIAALLTAAGVWCLT